MQRPRHTLPLMETNGNISIESIDLANIAKGEIKFVRKNDKGKPTNEIINLNKLLPEKHMGLLPVTDIIKYSKISIDLNKKHLTDKEKAAYNACMKKFLGACVAKIDTEIVASANGLLAHLLTLDHKYNSKTKAKKSKKVLVLYMNNPDRWGEYSPLDLEMYSLSKVVAEKKRAMGHDVTTANLTKEDDIPQLLNALAAQKKKFNDVCLVGHSLRFNYDNYEPPFKTAPPLQDVVCHHIGGFTVEDCADLLYQLSAKHGVTTVKSFACESGLMAGKEVPVLNDEFNYDDHGEIPHDLDLLSHVPSIIQLTLAHVALLAQLDQYQGNLGIVAIAPNGIVLIDSDNKFKFRLVDPKDYFQKKLQARDDIVARNKNRLYLPAETGSEELKQRAEHARGKLEHKLVTLKDRLPHAKNGDVIRLLKREIRVLEKILAAHKPEEKHKPSHPK